MLQDLHRELRSPHVCCNATKGFCKCYGNKRLRDNDFSNGPALFFKQIFLLLIKIISH